jgi:hypothetical protein
MCCTISRSFKVLGLVGLAILAIIGVASIQSTTAQETAKSAPATVTEMAKGDRMLRHVVLFQFKESSTPEQIEKVVQAFRELPKKIAEVADFEYGTDNSPEGLAEGLTHCFLLSFKSEKDRDVYLGHAEHKAFVDVLKPHLKRPVVVDYWSAR